MRSDDQRDDAQERAVDRPPAEEVRAWEQLEPGRFMPRRIRGSFRGGKLGWAFVIPPGPGGTDKR